MYWKNFYVFFFGLVTSFKIKKMPTFPFRRSCFKGSVQSSCNQMFCCWILPKDDAAQFPWIKNAFRQKHTSSGSVTIWNKRQVWEDKCYVRQSNNWSLQQMLRHYIKPSYGRYKNRSYKVVGFTNWRRLLVWYGRKSVIKKHSMKNCIELFNKSFN